MIVGIIFILVVAALAITYSLGLYKFDLDFMELQEELMKMQSSLDKDEKDDIIKEKENNECVSNE